MDNLTPPPNESRRGRRNGDNKDTRREIDKFHRDNGMILRGEQIKQGKALEALLTRNIAQMQQALDDLREGDKNV